MASFEKRSVLILVPNPTWFYPGGVSAILYVTLKCFYTKHSNLAVLRTPCEFAAYGATESGFYVFYVIGILHIYFVSIALLRRSPRFVVRQGTRCQDYSLRESL